MEIYNRWLNGKVSDAIRRIVTVTLVVAGCVAPPSIANAQFSSGSTGADGALDLTASPPGVVDFDPVALGIDPEGDSIFHFTTINIPSGVTLRLRADQVGVAPIHWLATGAVVIEGILDLDGEEGHSTDPNAVVVPAVPGPGGFVGGVGARSPNAAQAGSGPGGGGVNKSAGHATSSCAVAYGNAFLLPLIGGSGGGGFSGSPGAGGGAGGGAILIASSVSITVNGTIQARGGSAGPPTSGRAGSGSGGAIRLLAPSVDGTGTLSAAGGTRRSSSCNTPGAAGRIRIESDTNAFSGTTSGDLRIVLLVSNPVVLPTNPFPTIRIVSVGGVAAPPNPRGLFSPVDITVDTTTSVAVDLAAENIPLGTTITVKVLNQTTGTTAFVSSGLAGTEASSTASATVTVPAGFSQILTTASWTTP